MLLISFHVGRYLFCPIFSIFLRRSISSLACMAMPETAMHENYLFSGRENQIGFSRHVIAVKPIPITSGVTNLSNDHLGGGIFRFDRPHGSTALFGRFRHYDLRMAVALDFFWISSFRVISVVLTMFDPRCSTWNLTKDSSFSSPWKHS